MSAALGPAGLRGRDPAATAPRSVFTRPGPAAGPEKAHGARPARGAGRRGLCRAPRHARAPAALPWRIRLCPCPGGDSRRLRRLDPRFLGGAGASSDSAGRAQGSGGPGSAPAGSAAPVRPGGRGGNNSRDPEDLEEPFSVGGDPREPRVPRGGLSCASGPARAGGRELRGRGHPSLLGADLELCSGPRPFPLSRPRMERMGDCQTRSVFPCQPRPRGPRARDVTCSAVATGK